MVELTHLASLYHDDVMDEAALRRGADSANARWDNHVAILTGDFLFSKSSELTAELGPDAVRIQAADVHPAGRGPDPRDRAARPRTRTRWPHYLDVVAGKTGSLIATSARYGARFGGAGPRGRGGADGVRRDRRRGLPAQRRHPRHRLRHRRVRQDPGHRPARGRPDPAGADGARRRPTPRDARLLELLDGDLTDDDLHAEALDLLRKHPAIDEARAYVVARAHEAKALLTALPEGPVREALEAFADIVATRTA